MYLVPHFYTRENIQFVCTCTDNNGEAAGGGGVMELAGVDKRLLLVGSSI